MAIVKVTDSDFDSKIESGVKLVDFWATCGPCKNCTSFRRTSRRL